MTSPSPFLPGTNIQFAWDSTSLGDLKTCPRKYQYTMIEGWQSKGDNVHLRFGGEFHSAIQDYEMAKASGEPHESAVLSAVQSLLIRIHSWDVDTGTKAGNYKNPTTLLQLVIDYFDHYADDPAKTFILENGKPAVELSFKFELDWGPKADMQTFPAGPTESNPVPGQPYLICGHLDRVVTFGTDLFVLDHKTSTTTPSDYFFRGFNPSNQMTLYTLAGKVVLDAPIKGVIIEAAQICLDTPNKFIRKPTHRTQDQLDEWVDNLRYWFAVAESYAEQNYFPMNDTACTMYGGCKFQEVCSKSPQVREIYLKSDFIKLAPEDRWNPLKAR
jgi:hypothetical protein